MSTLVGIKRLPENAKIGERELLDAVADDPSLSFDENGASCVKWDGEKRSRGMWFNFREGELWSAGTVDDATLRKMQDIAHKLNAKLVTEEGDFFDLDERPAPRVRESLTRGQLWMRVYAIVLVVAALVFYFVRR